GRASGRSGTGGRGSCSLLLASAGGGGGRRAGRSGVLGPARAGGRVAVPSGQPGRSAAGGLGGVGVVGRDGDAVAEDAGVLVAHRHDLADGALVEGPEDGVVDHVVGAGHVDGELGHGGAAGGDQGGLDVVVLQVA